MNEHIRGATLHLRQLGGKAAVLEFCMGGALTLASAAMISELDSAVCYYGIPPAFDPKTVRVPVLMHFAKRDDWCTPANVEKLEEGFRAAGKSYELHRYDASHAFANDDRPKVYDPAATEQAWARTLAFLKKTL